MIKPAKQFQQIPNEFLRNTAELTNSALRVMLALVTYDPCHPDYKTLMLNTGLSKPSVAAAIKELKEAGYLLYKKGNSHRKQANQYTLTWNPVPLVQVKKLNSTPDIKLNNLTQSQSSSSKNELNVPAQVEYIDSEGVQVKNINSNNSNIYKDNTLELNNLTRNITPSELVAPQATTEDVNLNGNQDTTSIPEVPNQNTEIELRRQEFTKILELDWDLHRRIKNTTAYLFKSGAKFNADDLHNLKKATSCIPEGLQYDFIRNNDMFLMQDYYLSSENINDLNELINKYTLI